MLLTGGKAYHRVRHGLMAVKVHHGRYTDDSTFYMYLLRGARRTASVHRRGSLA